MSVSAPHMKPDGPMTRKLIVMASEMPARDQPVPSEMGWRNTASENIVPAATHDISAPAATMTQRY